MLTSIRSRIQALVLSSLVFASIALLSACGGGLQRRQQQRRRFAGRACHSEYSASGRNHQFSRLIHLHGLQRRPSPFTWSETGALPHGLMLASDGILSGTPTASGSFPVCHFTLRKSARSSAFNWLYRPVSISRSRANGGISRKARIAFCTSGRTGVYP